MKVLDKNKIGKKKKKKYSRAVKLLMTCLSKKDKSAQTNSLVVQEAAQNTHAIESSHILKEGVTFESIVAIRCLARLIVGQLVECAARLVVLVGMELVTIRLGLNAVEHAQGHIEVGNVVT